MKTVVTHSGPFQADDVFSIAVLTLIDPSITVIRSRDPEVLKKADLRVDVGLRYDPDTGDFDHHQKEGCDIRENDIPYSSAGLIWRHFGMRLVDTKEEWEKIDNKIVQFIDADDNGIKTYESERVSTYTLPKIVKSFSPCWDDPHPDFDKGFFKVVEVVRTILKNEIKKAKGFSKAKKIVEAAIKNSGKDIIVLDQFCPWKSTVIELTQAKFVVFPSSGGDWVVQSVPLEESGFESREKLPEKCGGLTAEQLQNVTGIKGLTFCHKGCWIAGAKTKESAIKLAELALNKR